MSDLRPHAFLTSEYATGTMVFDLSDERDRQALLDEVLQGGHFDDPVDNDLTLTIEIRPKPAGWAAQLPEFAGW